MLVFLAYLATKIPFSAFVIEPAVFAEPNFSLLSLLNLFRLLLLKTLPFQIKQRSLVTATFQKQPVINTAH